MLAKLNCCSRGPVVRDHDDTAQLLEESKARTLTVVSSKRPTCGQVCCGITLFLIAFVAWVAVRVATASCAIESFEPQLLIGSGPPVERGTSSNMDLRGLGVDLTGVWWMNGNKFVVEQLVSFAGASGKLPFPAAVVVPDSKARRWTWSDNFFGRAVMAWYEFETNSDAVHVFNFTNSSSATIDPVSATFGKDPTLFHFDKIDDDQWSRPDAHYILQRIVKADGSAGPYWQQFLTWYKGQFGDGKMVVWSSDSDCLRRCQFFLPCFACNRICGTA